MRLTKLAARRYRSLRDVTVELGDLNLFIGANASGKSSILDALRFLHEGILARDFRAAAYSRGGILNLAWKGGEADLVELVTTFDDEGKTCEWTVRLLRKGHGFQVEEAVARSDSQGPAVQVLVAREGVGSWRSGDEGTVRLRQAPTSCALAAAAADASFPARGVAEFVESWGFFDPDTSMLRRD